MKQEKTRQETLTYTYNLVQIGDIIIQSNESTLDEMVKIAYSLLCNKEVKEYLGLVNIIKTNKTYIE